MWSGFPAPYDISGSIEQTFGSWFLKNAEKGVFNYHLSFAQLDAATDILNEVYKKIKDIPYSIQNDTLLPYIDNYSKLFGKNLKESYKKFLEELSTSLKANSNNKGRIGLSFGGENATDIDNRFMPENLTPTQNITSVATNFYDNIVAVVDSVDFDNENGGFSPSDKQEKFFEIIHNLCRSGGRIELTLLGDPLTSIRLGMGNLLTKQAQYFDAVNLMLYGNGTNYYITANEKTSWSIQNWAHTLDISSNSSKEDIVNVFKKLNPCYQDKTPYNDPNADAGEKDNWALKAQDIIKKNPRYGGVDITTLSVGEAAWVLNRAFIETGLKTFDITWADSSGLIEDVFDAHQLSWWPDNNLHGDLCNTNTDNLSCNQYGVQQAFSACEILYKLGYNPFMIASPPTCDFKPNTGYKGSDIADPVLDKKMDPPTCCELCAQHPGCKVGVAVPWRPAIRRMLLPRGRRARCVLRKRRDHRVHAEGTRKLHL